MTNRTFDTQRSSNGNAVLESNSAAPDASVNLVSSSSTLTAFISNGIAGPTPIIRHATIMRGVRMSQIRDSEVGLGKKPLVLVNGRIKVRVENEGVPLILQDGQLIPITREQTLKV